MDDLWINKLRPKKIKNIIGHKYQIKKINEWLKKLSNQKIQALIISGNHGIGKTLTIQLVLEQNNYKVIIINPHEIKNYRISNNFFDYYNHNNSINNKMNINIKKIAIIFNETETISLTSEKKYLFEIFKMNNKFKAFPLIFISDNKHSKLLNDLKKYCQLIRFNAPSSYEIINFIKKTCNKEKINISGNKTYLNLVNFAQYDIRRLINLLQELSYHFKNKTITNKEIISFIKNSRIKNIDISLFDSTLKILNKYNNYPEIFKLYKSEKVLLPLMIQENYKKKVLNNNKENWEELIFKMVKISDSISRGDNIETSIYTDQNWYLQNIHGFYTCLNTSYWINKSNKNILNFNNIKFSSDLNKTSLKNINKKNINNLKKLVSKKSILEILMLCRISNHLINSNQEELLIKKLLGYSNDITIKNIELCLKIDKTNNFKQLTTKEKKKIIKIIETNKL